MPEANPRVTEYVREQEGVANQLAEEVRALILDVVPDAVEEFKWSQPCYSTTRPICYFKVARKHVTLGFNEGASLQDSDGLLEGTGKAMRHVKIPLGGGGIPSGVRDLLSQAAAL